MSEKNISRLTVFLAVFLILSLLLAALLFLNFRHNDRQPDTAVTYCIGSEKATVAREQAYQGETLMLNFTDLAALCGYSVIGDNLSQTFTGPEPAGETVIFSDGETACQVNGEAHILSAPCVFSDGAVWVPADFVRDYMEGVSCVFDEETQTLTLSRVKYAPGVSDEKEFTDVLFRIRPTAPIDSIGEGYAIVSGPVEFRADLSAYEKYMNPEDRDAYLLLVNDTHLLDETYKPDDLTALSSTRKDGRNTQYMREYAAKALEAMYLEMAEYGITDVSVTSAYRSYAYQKQLFNQYLNENMDLYATYDEAYQATRAVSALPGTSEHQSGLCCDMHNLSSASKRFAEKEAYTWLKDNSYKFGFIIRYPEDKTDITGYDFEPWHFRFVGRYHATMIHEAGMCLEEYIESLESKK